MKSIYNNSSKETNENIESSEIKIKKSKQELKKIKENAIKEWYIQI